MSLLPPQGPTGTLSRGGLCFGIVADRDLIADAWPIAEELRRAHDELLALVDGPASRWYEPPAHRPEAPAGGAPAIDD